MKICYNCFHQVSGSMRYCENCGNKLEDQDNSVFPGALPCGTTLYGRYLTGRVLGQDSLLITYIAQDSRTGETVAVREFFPKQVCERSSSTTVSIPDQLRSVFQEGKDLFLQESESLSDQREETGQPAGIQTFFNQNNTAYMVIEYTDARSLQEFLQKTAGRDFRREASRLLFNDAKPADDSRLPLTKTETADDSRLLFTGTEPADDSRTAVTDRENISFSSIPDNPVRESVPEDLQEDLKEDLKNDRETVPKKNLKEDLTKNLKKDPKEDPKEGTEEDQKEKSGRAENRDTAPGQIHGAGRNKKTGVLPFVGVIAAFFVCVALIAMLLLRISSGFGDKFRQIHFDRFFIQRIYRGLHRIPGKDSDHTDNKDSNKDSNKTKKETPAPGKYVSADDGGEEGITAGNFYNSGTFAVYGGDCYMIDSHGLNRWTGSDPDRSELITHSATGFLNVWQDHLYFLNEHNNQVRRCDPDGSHETIVLDPPADSGIRISTLCIRGDWCYFSGGNNLYRISMEELGRDKAGDIGQAVLITGDFNAPNYVYPSLCFMGDRIYYNGTLGVNGIYPDGSDKITISKHRGTLYTDGTSVFCDFGVSQIFRIQEDGTEEEILHLDGSEFMRKSNFCDGKIYYILMNEDEYELWRLDPDDFDREYVAALGSAKDSLISFCVFPGYDYGCIYLLKKGKAGSLTPVGEKYFLDP